MYANFPFHTKLPSQCFQKTIFFTCLSFSSHLSPSPRICVQSRQLYNHAFSQLIIFSLTNSAPVKHLIIYAGGIYRDPTQIFTFSPCLSGNFLCFPSIICMYVVFELKGKRKKGRKLKYMC